MKPRRADGERNDLHAVAEVAEHSLGMRKLMELFPNVITVADATEDKMLMVTDADVRRGRPNDPSACAVAQCALREGLGGMIGRQYAFLIDGTRVTRYHLGKDAQVRTALFDDRGTTKVGPILLNAPSPSHQLGTISRRINMHDTHAKKRKAKSPRAKSNKKSADRVRQTISTHGFRSWQQVQAPPTK
jgi:hypothetical protein